LPRGLPAAKNRPNGAARVPVGHGRPLGARACPPGTRGSTLSLGAAAGHRRRAFSARRGLDAPDRHPARERLAGVSRAGGERLLTGWDISAAGLAQSQPLVASSPLSPVVARAEMSTCSQLRGRGRTSQLLHRHRGRSAGGFSPPFILHAIGPHRCLALHNLRETGFSTHH
jgi:hypothetical protein